MKPDDHTLIRERICYSQDGAPEPVSLEVLVREKAP